MKKEKLKLTELRSFEATKEELSYLKGGDDDPEGGPRTCQWACDCTTSCIGTTNQQEYYRMVRNDVSGSTSLSLATDIAITLLLRAI